jgi:hypothetical protein
MPKTFGRCAWNRLTRRVHRTRTSRHCFPLAPLGTPPGTHHAAADPPTSPAPVPRRAGRGPSTPHPPRPPAGFLGRLVAWWAVFPSPRPQACALATVRHRRPCTKRRSPYHQTHLPILVGRAESRVFVVRRPFPDCGSREVLLPRCWLRLRRSQEDDGWFPGPRTGPCTVSSGACCAIYVPGHRASEVRLTRRRRDWVAVEREPRRGASTARE